MVPRKLWEHYWEKLKCVEILESLTEIGKKVTKLRRNLTKIAAQKPTYMDMSFII